MKKDYIYILIIIAIAIWAWTSSDNVSNEKAENKALKLRIENLEFSIERMSVTISISQKKSKLQAIIDSVQKEKIDSLIVVTNERHDPIHDPIPSSSARNDSITKWAKPWTTE